MFDAVARALEGDDVGVVNDPVDHRRGDGGFAEYLSPAGERQVRGQDDRGLLVSGGDQLEEQVGRFGVEGDVADFVDDNQAVAGDLAQFDLEAVDAVGFGQSADPTGGRRERDAVPAVGGGDRQRGGQDASMSVKPPFRWR